MNFEEFSQLMRIENPYTIKDKNGRYTQFYNDFVGGYDGVNWFDNNNLFEYVDIKTNPNGKELYLEELFNNINNLNQFEFYWYFKKEDNESSWYLIGKIKDEDVYFLFDLWCDYTGITCQSYSHVFLSETLEDLFNNFITDSIIFEIKNQ